MSFATKLAIAFVLLAALTVLVVALLHRILGRKRTMGVVIAGIIFVFSTIIALIAGEYVVRLAFSDVTTTGDNTSYFARKWKNENTIVVNSLGFREREPLVDPGENHFRIAVVGDSFGYGQGIADNARFSNLVEQDLAAAGRSIEVLNFGIPGAETVDHIEILRDSVLPLSPNYVLLQWFINDVENGVYADRPSYRRLIPSDTLSEYLHTHSALYYIANSFWSNLQAKLQGDERVSYTDYMSQRFGDPTSEDSRRADALLEEFIDTCETNGIDVGIVLFPQLTGDLDSYPLAFIHERVLNICERRGLTCIDLRRLYAGYPPRQLWANRLDPHPGILANRLAAGAILDAFGPSWDATPIDQP